MNKIKKLIPIMLLSSIFVNGSINPLAMDDIMTSIRSESSEVYNANEINQLYVNSQFSVRNLYNKICNKLWPQDHKDILNLNSLEKKAILESANEIIDEYINKFKGKDYYSTENPIKFDSCEINFETIMHALIVNLDRTGKFNSFAKSFILYLLAEYIGEDGLVKVIKYNECEYNENATIYLDKYINVNKYEAVFLFDCQNNEKSRSAEGCEYSPIPFDEKETIWKDMLNKKEIYGLEEYYLLIPNPKLNAFPKMFSYIRYLNSRESLGFFSIFQDIISPQRHDLQNSWPSDIQTDAIDITGEIIEKIM